MLPSLIKLIFIYKIYGKVKINSGTSKQQAGYILFPIHQNNISKIR